MNSAFCTVCYNHHCTPEDKQKCAEARARIDANQMVMKTDMVRRFGYPCRYCGGVHYSQAELAVCKDFDPLGR